MISFVKIWLYALLTILKRSEYFRLEPNWSFILLTCLFCAGHMWMTHHKWSLHPIRHSARCTVSGNETMTNHKCSLHPIRYSARRTISGNESLWPIINGHYIQSDILLDVRYLATRLWLITSAHYIQSDILLGVRYLATSLYDPSQVVIIFNQTSC